MLLFVKNHILLVLSVVLLKYIFVSLLQLVLNCEWPAFLNAFQLRQLRFCHFLYFWKLVVEVTELVILRLQSLCLLRLTWRRSHVEIGVVEPQGRWLDWSTYVCNIHYFADVLIEMVNLIVVALVVFTSVIYINVLSFIMRDFLVVAVFRLGAFLLEVEGRLHVAATEGGLVMVVMRTHEGVFMYLLFYYEIIVVVFLFLVLGGLGVLEVLELIIKNWVHFVRGTS